MLESGGAVSSLTPALPDHAIASAAVRLSSAVLVSEFRPARGQVGRPSGRCGSPIVAEVCQSPDFRSRGVCKELSRFRRPEAVTRELEMVARGGVEPPTFRFSVGRSYQLSYLAGNNVRNYSGPVHPLLKLARQTTPRRSLCSREVTGRPANSDRSTGG